MIHTQHNVFKPQRKVGGHDPRNRQIAVWIESNIGVGPGEGVGLGLLIDPVYLYHRGGITLSQLLQGECTVQILLATLQTRIVKFTVGGKHHRGGELIGG